MPPAKRTRGKPPSRRGGWGGSAADEKPVRYGPELGPVLDPTRPCPACRTPAHAQRFANNDLGAEWVCQRGHRFVVGPRRADLAVCHARDRKAKEPPCALVGVGPFLMCRAHDVAIWPNDDESSPVELCANGRAVWQRIVDSFAASPALREGPREGEVPFGFTDVEWAERLAGLEPDAAPVEPPVDRAGDAVNTPSPMVVTPTENDAPVTATTTRPAVERLFPVAEVPVAVKRKDVTALSPSSALVLAQCPRRFEETKVLGRKEPVGRAASLGKFVHKVLELLTVLPPEERTEDAARDLAGRLWRDVDRDPDDPVEFDDADEGDVLELRRDRVELARDVDDMAAWVRRFKGESWAALAYAVSIEGSYGGEVAYREMGLWDTTVGAVPFRGYADRIDRHRSPTRDGLVVVDYKSGSIKGLTDKRTGKIDQRKLDEKGEQLLLYAGPVEQKTGERVVGALLAYIGAGAQVVLWVDDAKRAAAKAKLARLWRDLGRFETAARTSGERYPAKEGYLCGWCPFFEDCPEGSAWLLSGQAAEWMKQRDVAGEPPVPAMVEVRSWSRERRQAWWESTRAG